MLQFFFAAHKSHSVSLCNTRKTTTDGKRCCQMLVRKLRVRDTHRNEAKKDFMMKEEANTTANETAIIKKNDGQRTRSWQFELASWFRLSFSFLRFSVCYLTLFYGILLLLRFKFSFHLLCQRRNMQTVWTIRNTWVKEIKSERMYIRIKRTRHKLIRLSFFFPSSLA